MLETVESAIQQSKNELTPKIEISERCSQELDHLRQFTDDTERFKARSTNPEVKYENVFGDRYIGKSNGQKVEVQYYTGDNDQNPYKVTIEEDGIEVKKDIMARMWVTDTSKQPPAALCYELTPDGNWYVRESDNYRKGAEDNIQDKGYQIWRLRKAEQVSKEHAELNVFDKLKSSQRSTQKVNGR